MLLLCAVAGVLGGGALIGTWALGVCLIFCSLCAGGWALFHDDGQGAQPLGAQPQEEGIRPGAWLIDRAPLTLRQVFDRARAS